MAGNSDSRALIFRHERATGQGQKAYSSRRRKKADDNRAAAELLRLVTSAATCSKIFAHGLAGLLFSSASSRPAGLGAFMVCDAILDLKIRRTTTKNTGTKMTASKVAVIIPPATPVPMSCRLAEPAPVLNASGDTPRMNASDVIRIGRSRKCAASSVDSIRPLP